MIDTAERLEGEVVGLKRALAVIQYEKDFEAKSKEDALQAAEEAQAGAMALQAKLAEMTVASPNLS